MVAVPQKIKHTSMNIGRWFFYVLTIAALILVYLKFSELRLLKELFIGSNFRYLFAIMIVQIISSASIGFNYRAVLKMKGLTVPVWELFPMGLVIQFISQALPSAGLSGQIFFIYYLRKYGMTLAEGIGRAILEVVTLYISYIILFIIAVVLIITHGGMARNPNFVYFYYGFIIFLMACALIFFLSQRREKDSWVSWGIRHFKMLFSDIFGQSGFRKIIESDRTSMIIDQFKSTLSIRELRKHGWTFFIACWWQAVDLLTDMLTLYLVALALGIHIPFAICFIAYMLSKFLSMISLLPGAPGIFEGSMTLILISFGIPTSPALAATLLTRAFTFWLPMPVGWLLYNRYIKQAAQSANT